MQTCLSESPFLCWSALVANTWMFASRRQLHSLHKRSTACTGPVEFTVGVGCPCDFQRTPVRVPRPDVSYSHQGSRVCTGTRVAGPAAPYRGLGYSCGAWDLSQQEFEQAFDFCETAKGERDVIQRLREHGIQPLTMSQQEKRYMGNHLARIPSEFRQSNTISFWLEWKEPELVTYILDDQIKVSGEMEWSDWLTFRKLFSVDHIIPKSRGGKNHPCNYFIMPLKVNNHFGNYWTAEKVVYIGKAAAIRAGRLHGFKPPAHVRV